MMYAGVIFFICFLLTGLFWYFFFRRREKKLLDRLQELIDTAAAGGQVSDDIAPLPRTEISESRFSLLENSLKRYLAESTLSATIPTKQKETIQSLISDIAHQTLTPISNLKLYSELLMEHSGGQEEEIFTIHEQAEKLDFLIRSLVMLSRMENGILNIHAQSGYVKELLDTVNREYAPLAAAKHISWFCICDPSLLALFDLKWTAEALGNIADNAIKYTQEGGRITITAEKYTFFVRIDIADSGMGIPEEEQSRIFARFYRSPAVSDRPGVGIGLYLARQIVQAQKGYIKVRSVPGEGSVFSVFLHV